MKHFLFISTLVLFSITVWAQAPTKLNYQAVIRDNSGVPLVSTPVSITFTVHKNTEGAQ